MNTGRRMRIRSGFIRAATCEWSQAVRSTTPLARRLSLDILSLIAQIAVTRWRIELPTCDTSGGAKSRRNIGDRRLSSLGRWSIGVLPRLAIDQQENQQHNTTDQRHQLDQYPPSAAAGVMQPSDGDGKRGNQHSQRVNAGQYSKTCTPHLRSDESIDNHKND